KARAAARLPEPRGPANNQACTVREPTALRSNATARSWPTTSAQASSTNSSVDIDATLSIGTRRRCGVSPRAEDRVDTVSDVSDRARSVDTDPTSGVGDRLRPVTVGDTLVKVDAGGLQPIRFAHGIKSLSGHGLRHL